MTILVTGATGNIGRRVVEGLVGAGQRVRAMVRDPLRARRVLPEGVEVVHGDFDRPGSWPEALAGADRVYLFPLVYRPEPGEPGFVEQAAAAGVRRFVVHSAAAAGFAPSDDPSALGRHLEEERAAHRGIELMVEATGREWTHVRPGLLAANALGWAERIRTGRAVREPYGSSGYPLVHEADVAEVAVAALLTDAHLGAAYTITGPAKVTQLEQVAAIEAAIGAPVGFEEPPPAQARAEMLADGYPPDEADWLVELLADAVDGPGVLPPTGTYQEITGRPPRSFARWARDHAAAFLPAAA
ncbi:NAD(P)H-binding protein [Allonocardiopsis opalescens]|uniref:Uncharacterized protein YbjT (DUF2867 family) n=1 Tax=Allonocardiopsis opalescens TaxID=1144618 RepID=A0A2T0Q9S6_9ACTN|nr:NAD(P)H-binding protein [Allonocardiopsis opalescens]PRY00595.1 uncharacterized protein YbjT (DUF2867 family) [Allonocardiopsis opalescens]